MLLYFKEHSISLEVKNIKQVNFNLTLLKYIYLLSKSENNYSRDRILQSIGSR